jgi:hypothetical protein
MSEGVENSLVGSIRDQRSGSRRQVKVPVQAVGCNRELQYRVESPMISSGGGSQAVGDHALEARILTVTPSMAHRREPGPPHTPAGGP